MAKDHFVAQTYLKHFGDPAKGGMLNAYRKSDGKTFRCWPADICHEKDGDLNPMLREPELLGDYRAIFEPFWTVAVERVLARDIRASDLFALSGYIASLMACTPTWRRVGVKMSNDQAKGMLLFKQKMQAQDGKLDPELTEAYDWLEKGKLVIETDPNWMKAMATQSLVHYAVLTYHADWTILENPTDLPFITSDNPVAYFDRGPNVYPAIRYVPMTPELCVRLVFDPRYAPRERLTPEEVARRATEAPRGMMRRAVAKKVGVRHINSVVAQNAENLVLSSSEYAGGDILVEKYGKYGVEVDYVELRDGVERSMIQGVHIRVKERGEEPR